ncbi:MAG: PEP-CTERM system TPR-repeat protein PrsT, partial [Gammaproteobacteria bacterium]|nr:PEP-CTERM system TPR-repeat protein PrsT [Gammaproteobacteria bacterium]
MNTSHRRSTHAKQSILQRLSTHKRLLMPAAVAILAGLGSGAYYLTKAEASPEERLAAAHKFEQAGDHKGAVIELKNVLQVAPTNAEARFLLGRVHYATNDFLNAEKEFRKAQNAGNKQPELAYMLGRTLLMLRRPEKIMEEIHEIPGASPADNAAILALRAHAQLLLGDKAGMEKALGQADALLPEHPDTLVVRAGVAHTQGQTAEALALIDKALAKAAQRADLWVMKGDLLRTAGKFPEAMTAYAKATSIDPGNLPARLASTQYYVSTSALDKAEAELKALQAVAPNNLMGRYFGALIDFRRNQYDAANNKLQEVLRGAPDFTPANLLAGIANIRLGKHENAITHLNRVLEQVPAHPLARKLLAGIMMETGQFGRAKELIANLDNDDNDALLLSLRGNLALQAGAYQEARNSLEKASALAPDDQNLIRGIAASRMASGDEVGAIAALTQLSEKEGKSHQADVLLVLTHVKAKRYDEALKVIDKLSGKNPRLALAENLRGAVYVARNEIPQAQQSFLKALEYDPGYIPA